MRLAIAFAAPITPPYNSLYAAYVYSAYFVSVGWSPMRRANHPTSVANTLSTKEMPPATVSPHSRQLFIDVFVTVSSAPAKMPKKASTTSLSAVNIPDTEGPTFTHAAANPSATPSKKTLRRAKRA